MPHYDAIVIGSGQAGNPLSQKLADQGWTVALIEKEHRRHLRQHRLYANQDDGRQCPGGPLRPPCRPLGGRNGSGQRRSASVVARKTAVVNQWRSGVDRKIHRPNLHLYGHGRFLAPHRIRVNQEEIESERIFINTGTRPGIPLSRAWIGSTT